MHDVERHSFENVVKLLHEEAFAEDVRFANWVKLDDDFLLQLSIVVHANLALPALPNEPPEGKTLELELRWKVSVHIYFY